MRFMSAGESHGRCLIALLEGLPAGLTVDLRVIDADLARRQQGYGRGGRMQIEKDTVTILSGLKAGKTIGSPVTLMIENRDFKIDELPAVYEPRPGHADLSGALKYGFSDMRCVLERASARETAARVAAGALCRIFLKEFGVNISSRVVSVAGESDQKKINKKIDAARKSGDTLGGIFEVHAENVPLGLGSYVHYDRRLDARLAFALMSIPAIKGVEFGLGFAACAKRGSEVHDAIYYSARKGFYRKTNNAGGVEGGMSNGRPLIIRCAMKPIATLGTPLPSVDIRTKKKVPASIQRSDIAAVEAAGVIAEAMTAITLSDAFLERYGQDDIKRIKRAYKAG
ncbi:MAG: chorismate synthase [Candidatus Omnitrophica bacterium]|nr:chorismate synthase [Candidatus Omnitrophota bacterium]MBU4479083.1 chorismate synthase [Candidatus Omnitrophota bacterium]MCG2703004.1 chorismate synthase [Candidatus Omnitrophota bacterium]